MLNSAFSFFKRKTDIDVIQWILSVHLLVRFYAETKKGNRLYAALQYSASYANQKSTVLVTLRKCFLCMLTRLWFFLIFNFNLIRLKSDSMKYSFSLAFKRFILNPWPLNIKFS